MGINIQKIKNVIRLVLPPLFVKAYKIVAKNGQLPLNLFEGIYENFSDIKNVTQYDTQESLGNTYIETIEKLKDSQRKKLVPKSEIRSQICNLLPMLAAIFTDREKEISIVDVGGGWVLLT